MTYREIFEEIYKENRKFIVSYLMYALITSIFIFSGSLGHASSGEALDIMQMSGTTTVMLVILLGQMVPSLDPAVALGASCIISIISDYVTLPGEMSQADFGLLATSWVFRILVLIYSICVILPKHLNVSSIMGLELEDVSRFLSFALVVVNIFPSLLYINSFSVNAAETVNNTVTVSHSPVLAVFNFFVMVAGLLSYYFIRYFIMFLNVISIPVRAIVPGSSFVFELIKNICIVLMVLISHGSKPVALAIMIIILIISVLFFKRAYVTVRYFKNVYVRPVIKKLFKDQKQLSLVDDKMPRMIKKLLEEKQAVLAIPVYPVRSWSSERTITKYDRWWLVKDIDGAIAIYKRNGFKKELISVSFEDDKMFINKAFRFINIFSLSSEENIGKRFKRLPKVIEFVISKEYSNRYEEIVDQTGYIEFAAYTEMINERRESEKAAMKENENKKPIMTGWKKKNAKN